MDCCMIYANVSTAEKKKKTGTTLLASLPLITTHANTHSEYMHPEAQK